MADVRVPICKIWRHARNNKLFLWYTCSGCSSAACSTFASSWWASKTGRMFRPDHDVLSSCSDFPPVSLWIMVNGFRGIEGGIYVYSVVVENLSFFFGFRISSFNSCLKLTSSTFFYYLFMSFEFDRCYSWGHQTQVWQCDLGKKNWYIRRT
jgi:hypothetical protein